MLRGAIQRFQAPDVWCMQTGHAIYSDASNANAAERPHPAEAVAVTWLMRSECVEEV